MRRGVYSLVALVLVLCTGCLSSDVALRPKDKSLPVVTGKVYNKVDLQHRFPGLIFGDDYYDEVDSRWLSYWYEQFRLQLFKLGVVRGNQQFDCNRFADFYVSMAQACYSSDQFQYNVGNRVLAIGTVWYVKSSGGGRHAIVQAITECGRIYIEPQNGERLTLTSQEEASIYLQII